MDAHLLGRAFFKYSAMMAGLRVEYKKARMRAFLWSSAWSWIAQTQRSF